MAIKSFSVIRENGIPEAFTYIMPSIFSEPFPPPPCTTAGSRPRFRRKAAKFRKEVEGVLDILFFLKNLAFAQVIKDEELKNSRKSLFPVWRSLKEFSNIGDETKCNLFQFSRGNFTCTDERDFMEIFIGVIDI
jgi:hypothetical protein